MRPNLHVKKGDYVTVMKGADKGKTGRVLRVIPREGLAVVEKIRVAKKHARPTQKNPQGGITEVSMPIPAAKLMVVCMHCRKPTRLKRVKIATGEKVRVCRHCNEHLDKA